MSSRQDLDNPNLINQDKANDAKIHNSTRFEASPTVLVTQPEFEFTASEATAEQMEILQVSQVPLSLLAQLIDESIIMDSIFSVKF